MQDRYQHNIDWLGCYHVADKTFKDKVAALIYSTKVNVHPQWVFNNNVYDTFNWSIEPSESIDELYRQRAQDIRDRYEYVALGYSGGSDSHNILMTFLNNNIRLDELVVSWPVKRSERLGADATDLSYTNYTSEWELTVKPRLKWVAHQHPDIKITVNDWTDEIEKISLPDDLLTYRGNFAPLYGNLRFNRMSDLGRIYGQEGIIIYGIDKPRVCVHQDHYKLFFVDVVAQGIYPFIDDRCSATELFYWSPKSCKLLCKQAHMVANYAEKNKHFKQTLQWPWEAKNRQLYEAVTRSIVYPSINVNVFQTDKPQSHNVGLDAVVAGTDLESGYMSTYLRNWTNLQEVIDAKYFKHENGHITLNGFINGMWPFKPA